MKGRNELKLNEATMIEALQQWLDAKMPNGAPQVVSVKKGNNQGSQEDMRRKFL